MCESKEEAEERCVKLFGHRNVVRPDIASDGSNNNDTCYYSGPDDLEWLVKPDDHEPGLTAVRPRTVPLCYRELPQGDH